MASKVATDAIQKDWNEREMIEVIHLNILKVSQAKCFKSPHSLSYLSILRCHLEYMFTTRDVLSSDHLATYHTCFVRVLDIV